MPFSYPTVMINSTTYPVYGDVAVATAYLQADITSPATAWLAANALTQARSIVAAVRWLDAETWLGLPADQITPQALQWPRINLVDQYGQPLSSTALPLQLVAAEIVLAAALVDNPDLRDQLQDPTPKSLRAGSASIDFFRPLGTIFGGKDVQVLTVFPQNVMDLVGLWLAGGVGSRPSVLAEGSHEKSPFDDDLGVIHGF